MQEQEIIALFQKRDQEAITQTDRTYGSMCRSLSGRILRNREDAEECVNDSYYRLWERIPPEKPVSLPAYLAKIVRNLSLDRLRETESLKRGGGAVTVALEELRSVSSREDVEQQVAARDLSRAIDSFLRTQPQRSRNVFLRRYFYFEDRDEISRRYSISAAQVSVILSRTRKKLRKYLTEEGLL